MFSNPFFYLVLFVACLAFIAKNRYFFHAKQENALKETVFWGAALIGFLFFFWILFYPWLGLISFCLYPLIFFVFLGVIVFINLRRAFFNIHTLIASTKEKRFPSLKNMGAVFVSLVAWLIALSLPFGFTWEAWHLDKHWSDYNAAVQFATENLTSSIYRELPSEYHYLAPAYDDLVYWKEDSCCGQINFNHGTYDRYGYVPRILYCPDEQVPCEPHDSGWLHPPMCFSIRPPHWYRCGYPPFD